MRGDLTQATLRHPWVGVRSVLHLLWLVPVGSRAVAMGGAAVVWLVLQGMGLQRYTYRGLSLSGFGAFRMSRSDVDSADRAPSHCLADHGGHPARLWVRAAGGGGGWLQRWGG